MLFQNKIEGNSKQQKTSNKPTSQQANKPTKMSSKDIVDGLDKLIEYPDLMEYIKTFDSPLGFMFTQETEAQRKEYKNRLSDLLDSKGMHSGGTWGCMLRGIQTVLNGINTREYFVEKVVEEERFYKEFMIELDTKRAQAQAEKEQAEQKQAQKQAEEHANMLAEFENSVETAKKEKAILDEAEYKMHSC